MDSIVEIYRWDATQYLIKTNIITDEWVIYNPVGFNGLLKCFSGPFGSNFGVRISEKTTLDLIDKIQKDFS